MPLPTRGGEVFVSVAPFAPVAGSPAMTRKGCFQAIWP